MQSVSSLRDYIGNIEFPPDFDAAAIALIPNLVVELKNKARFLSESSFLMTIARAQGLIESRTAKPAEDSVQHLVLALEHLHSSHIAPTIYREKYERLRLALNDTLTKVTALNVLIDELPFRQ